MSGILGGRVGYEILRHLNKSSATHGWCDGSAYRGRSKLEVLLGPEVWSTISGRAVIDFGCGDGDTAIEMAQHGAALVIGVDIRQSALTEARSRAERAGVAGRCVFADAPPQPVDVIVSVDGFEHFDHPGEVLSIMRHSLKPGGRGSTLSAGICSRFSLGRISSSPRRPSCAGAPTSSPTAPLVSAR